MREYLAAFDGQMVLLDPPEMFDKAILGTTERDGGYVAAYDADKIREILRTEQDMEDPEEAYEFYSYNIEPLSGMPQGPVFIERLAL